MEWGWSIFQWIGPRSVGVLLGPHQRPVGYDRKGLGDGDDHLGGDAVVGIIVAGEPVVIVFGLALGPDGHGLLGIGGVWRHEMQTRFG